MRIDITGYVTKTYQNYQFTIKVTSDSVERLPLSNLQVSKEVRIFISPDHYPFDQHNEFRKLTAWDDPRIEDIKKSHSLGKALRMGDQIECSVFIVEPETRNGVPTHAINRNRRDIETYADFPLWLYPNNGNFRRSESDSRKSLKFRKQWRYTCINKEKCGKITGYTYKYRSSRWINKNPKITFPILWWLRIKTTVSKLWKREKRPKLSNPITIISIVVTTISIIVTLWALFFK